MELLHSAVDSAISIFISNEDSTAVLKREHRSKFIVDGEQKLFSKIQPVSYFEMTNPSQGSIDGFMYLTNYRVYFQNRTSLSPIIVSIPLTSILTAKSEYQTSNAYKLVITTRDFRCLQFVFEGKETAEQHFNIALKCIQKESTVESIENLFAFQYRADIRKKHFSEGQIPSFNEWRCYDPVQEFARMGINKYSKTWTVTDINKDYKLCETYPAYLCFPSGIDQSELHKIAEFRSKHRLPTLTWKHPNSNSTLSRSSQPLVGWSGQSDLDEMLITQMRLANPSAEYYYILDARPKANAMGNQVAGAGWEKGYTNCVVQFMNIENIHEMRSSFNKLFNLIKEESQGSWHYEIENTQWLKHIQIILKASNRMVDYIVNKNSSILVHCSDGWDRTSQILSLTQLMVDPYYRTMEGFIVLIEKEWLSFGHQFSERYFGWNENKHNLSKTSPIFLQFIDCVYQLCYQFPLSFEFNTKFLIYLLDCTNDCKYGNFLYNSEKQRIAASLHTKTESVWHSVMSNKDRFYNPMYRMYSHHLQASENSKKIHFWDEYYLRWDTAHKPKESAEIFIQELLNKNKELHFTIQKMKESQTKAVRAQNLTFLRTESKISIKAAIEMQMRELVCSIVDKSLSVAEEKKFAELTFEDPRTPPPKWKSDTSTDQCTGCKETFTFFRRRVKIENDKITKIIQHHCRYCGEIFCDTCTSKKKSIPQFAIFTPVRICNACDKSLSEPQNILSNVLLNVPSPKQRSRSIS